MNLALFKNIRFVQIITGMLVLYFFFFKQKTAYEIKECDWSSDVCSSDLDGTSTN